MPPSKAKAGPTKGKSGGKVKNGLQMPKINGVDNAAEVEAASGVGYYSGPTPPASIYRLKLRMMFVKMNKSDDLRFTWVANIDEEGPRKKYNGYTVMNGENYSQSGLPYINKMLDSMGLDRDAFHNGGIRVDDPRIDLSDKLSKQVVEAVGKQSIGEDCGIVFYSATKSENYNNEDRLAHVQYMDEEAWERAVAGAGGVEDEDEDDDTEDVELEDDDEEEDDADADEESEDEDEDDDDEEDDEEDEEDDDDEDEDEDDEDDEPDLTELSLKDLKQRVVDDTRWKDFTKTAQLKGYEKDNLVDMLQNGPQEPKKGKKAKKGATKVPF